MSSYLAQLETPPVSIGLFKVNNGETRAICSKLCKRHQNDVAE